MARTGHEPLMASVSDAETRRVLSTIYRARPDTRSQLAEFESMPHSRLSDILLALEADGLIALSGDRIEALSPDRVVSATMSRVLNDARSRLATLIDATVAISGLTRDWELGASGDNTSGWAEIIHGHEAQWQAWGRYSVTHPPRQPINIYPDLSIVKAIILPSLAVDNRVTAPVRIVCPASVLATSEDRAALDALSAAGAQIRIVESVPSWVYADAGVLCALPLTWGEHPPSSIVIVQQPAIVEAVNLLVEAFWDRGMNYPAADQGWRPVLALLARGMPDATIGETLGLSLRTVQRRIGEAMDFYAVRSRFELGSAWAKEGVQ